MITEILLGVGIVALVIFIFKILMGAMIMYNLNKEGEELAGAIEELFDEMDKRQPIFENGQMVQHKLSGEKMLILSPGSIYSNKDFDGFYEVRVLRGENYYRETFKEEELDEIKVSSIRGSRKSKK